MTDLARLPLWLLDLLLLARTEKEQGYIDVDSAVDL
jgi:hypothetical protein